MKKKLFAAIILCMALVLVLAGCQAALLSTNVTVYADGSGVKTITAVIYGDECILAGEEGIDEPGLVGNNSKYLLVSGDALVNKIKSYSALEDIQVTASEQDGKTILTVSYAFSSMDDYFAKTKTLAKDNADKIEAPTFTDNGDGTFTFKENTENTGYAVDNLFQSLYNDPEAFSKDGQGDCNLEEFGYDYTCIYTVLAESATVGDQTTTVNVNEYNETNTIIELDWEDYIEVTGKPAAASSDEKPEPTETQATEPQPTQPAEEKTDSSTGLIIGIVAACVVVAAVVVIVIVSKKKKA
ncbi:MAG: hypothetical protein PUB93_08310 [Firmicutes bacterium]|nr:hypothetical protein [Bacillota bacterium]